MSYVSNLNRRVSKASRLDIPFNQSFQEQSFTGRIFHFAKVHLGLEGWFHSMIRWGAPGTRLTPWRVSSGWVGRTTYYTYIYPKKKWTKRPSWMMLKKTLMVVVKPSIFLFRWGFATLPHPKTSPQFLFSLSFRDQKIKLMRDLPVFFAFSEGRLWLAVRFFVQMEEDYLRREPGSFRGLDFCGWIFLVDLFGQTRIQKCILNNFIHPGKLTSNTRMEVWKMIFLCKQVIFLFHVNFPECMCICIHTLPHLAKVACFFPVGILY